MGIVFFCQSCGHRFDVPEAMAGKRGRCKSCSQMMTIPKATELASMMAMPALSGAAAQGGAGPVGAKAPAASWIAAASSSVALAPMTIDQMSPAQLRALRVAKEKEKAEFEDDTPYKVVDKSIQTYRPPVSRPASGLIIFWREQFGYVQRAFKWLNEMAYFISVPFLTLLLLAAVLQNRSMALMAATVVVVLNLARILSGLANILIIPFRQSPITGILCLFPPYTAYYIYSNWFKLRKPTMRIVEPVVTIALLVLAFTFLPGLSKNRPSKKGIVDQVKAGAKSFTRDIEGQIEQAGGTDIGQLKRNAAKTVKQAGSKALELIEEDPTLAEPTPK